MPVQAESASDGLIESWANWEGEAIDGTFLLRRLLGRSDHSLSFLTAVPAQGVPDATIKIVPAALAPADTLLANWKDAALLSHPHLVRILASGRCERAGQFLYVVTEYAEETLSEILPQRALTADEVKFLLSPLVEVLAFLHARRLVHGQIKPSNVLVIHDQVKLSADTVRPASDARAGMALPSPYDAPEVPQGSGAPAGDIWALGITLVEALTQHTPSDEELSDFSLLQEKLPKYFKTLVARCLSPNPALRPSAVELRTYLRGESPLREVATAATAAPMPMVQQPRAAPAPEPAPRPRRLPLAVGLAVLLILVWAGVRLFQQPGANPPAAAAPEAASSSVPSLAQPVIPEPAIPAQPAASPAESLPTGVVHQEMPAISRNAASTIHGHFQVAVRVSVNRAGDVMDETFEDAGPSAYFARAARRAASQWKFARATDPAPREWLLRFEFSRDGTSVRAEANTIQ